MKISFFHNSNEYRTEFTSKIPNRPTFYWFSDRFHDHYGYGIEGTYFYLFVKDPTESNISFRVRNGAQRDFHDLYSDFLCYKKSLVQKQDSNGSSYAEPPILMSFDYIKPDLIAKYHKKSNDYEILHPEVGSNKRFTLYELTNNIKWPVGIPFNKVPELIEVLPDLNNAIPFCEPNKIDGRYVYDKWVPMVTEKNGTWL